jgi:formimidoylglutamate deiminase
MSAHNNPVKRGTIVTMTLCAEQALLPGGWAEGVVVDIAGDRIARVTSGPAPAGAQRVAVLLPAPANLHSHAFQRAMAGLTERRGPDPRDSFWTWRQLMFRFLDQLTPEDVQAIAAFVQMEMLEAGYACNVEFHYLHHQPGGAPYADLAEMSARIAAAAAETGIGLTLLPVLYQHGGLDRRPLGPGQVRFGNDPDRFARLVEGAKAAVAALPRDACLGIAPHSLRAVSAEGLAACVGLRPDEPLHMHLAEQLAEVEEVQAATGARPVEWLLDNAAVDDRWCLIHCTQMQPHETRALAASGAVAGLCPITESSLGDGIFDGANWIAHGGRFGIGSDSNIRIALAEEFRTLEYSQRLRDRSRAALATAGKSTGRVLFEGAVAGGAQAAGRDSGAIAAGRLADLLALDGDAVDLVGRVGDAVLDCWIFAGDDRMVRDVWAAGRHVVREGRHIRREAITRAYLDCTRRLKALA